MSINMNEWRITWAFSDLSDGLSWCLCPVSISFENYRMVHPYEDSDSSEDEVDWQDTRHDPYRAGNCSTVAGQNNRNAFK